ncbi:MAG: alpha/beta fold hydrolase [Pseudomonadota bacterium]
MRPLIIDIRLFYIAVLSLFFSSNSLALEERILLKNNVIATHYKTTHAPKAAVLMIHGWAGQMDEVGDMYKRLAKTLADRNIASLRVNIRGESEQAESGYTLTSTFSSRVEDAFTGFEFLQMQYPENPLGVVGFSLGGSTAIALVGKKAKDIDSLVLWSSAGNPSEVVNNLLTPAQRDHVLQYGKVILNEWVDLTVTKKHYEGFFVSDIFPAFDEYTGALLTIRGTEDYLQDIDKMILSRASDALEEARYISGADHIFNVFDPNTSYDQRVLEQTVQWFSTTLN